MQQLNMKAVHAGNSSNTKHLAEFINKATGVNVRVPKASKPNTSTYSVNHQPFCLCIFRGS